MSVAKCWLPNVSGKPRSSNEPMNSYLYTQVEVATCTLQMLVYLYVSLFVFLLYLACVEESDPNVRGKAVGRTKKEIKIRTMF